MKVLQLSAIAALAVGVLAPTAFAYDMATTKNLEKQCKAVSTCNKGGSAAVPCVIRTQNCPACVTFDNNACYELVNGGCNFGTDCTAAWASEGSGSSSSATGSKSTTTPPSTPTATNSSSNSNTTGPSSDSSSSSASSKNSGTDMSVVFGIVGAAIGVIAVAIIFLALVRRSRAAEEEEEEAATPQMAKAVATGPSTTTNAATYAPYAQRSGTNPTTPTNRVIKYYNDNAMPSPHGSRGGGGGFGQPAQQQPQVKTVRPAAAANPPTFFKQTSQAAPVPPPTQMSQMAAAPPPPPVSTAVYQQSQRYPSQGGNMSAVPTAEPLFTVHTGPDEPQAVRRVSSPRSRRESYEF